MIQLWIHCVASQTNSHTDELTHPRALTVRLRVTSIVVSKSQACQGGRVDVMGMVQEMGEGPIGGMELKVHVLPGSHHAPQGQDGISGLLLAEAMGLLGRHERTKQAAVPVEGDGR